VPWLRVEQASKAPEQNQRGEYPLTTLTTSCSTVLIYCRTYAERKKYQKQQEASKRTLTGADVVHGKGGRSSFIGGPSDFPRLLRLHHCTQDEEVGFPFGSCSGGADLERSCLCRPSSSSPGVSGTDLASSSSDVGDVGRSGMPSIVCFKSASRQSTSASMSWEPSLRVMYLRN